ncbi:MAG: helix-turn-helix transcriptional regulator [Rhodocyclales bacterium]|jgi:transcriptional regulator with XRE-family HTH domain|nr:helix-turn-helix transcriptional regulator [Rhodocyclales bacterium]
MASPATPKRKAPARKRATTKPAPPRHTPEQAESSLVDQMRSMAGKVLDAGAATVGAAATLQTATSIARTLRAGKPMEAAADVLKAMLPSLTEPGVWTRTGAALRRMRKAAGLTITEVGAAINLKDPSLIEAWENGRIAVPFELVLRLAAVLGRNDPVGFVMKFTRSSNPDLWRALEGLGVGKLLIQSAREREFANIYRADDEARKLSDEEFAEVLTFTRAAFEMAMAFRGRSSKHGS